ncbi:MAG TPA: carbon monoxide dehydrogenase subunit G [Thermoanaerobaculia bacterium]|nr:carbon monoxide dehydrogenase subunit G [Thermoanaerobaculia bacterium]
MKITGTYTLPAPRDAVWQALLDPEVLSRTLPGCERLERVGEGRFEGVLNVQVGPVKGQFEGTLDLTDLRPPQGYRMKLDGRGPSGFMTGEGSIDLEEVPAGTLVRYDLDARVGGRIAGVGQRLLDSSARVITRQGLEGLERQLAARQGAAGPAPGPTATPVGHEGEPPAPAPVVPPAAPTQREFAARFARGMVDDLLPRRVQRWVLMALLAILLIAVLLLMRGCPG